MKHYVLRVLGASDGSRTPHDNRYIVAWNPHTEAGTLELTSTDKLSEAHRWHDLSCFDEWKTISHVQPKRPWDGKPNRPLTAISILSEPLEDTP